MVKRILLISLFFIVSLETIVFSQEKKIDNTSNMENAKLKQIIPDKSTVKFIGRVSPIETGLWCAYSGTGISFAFTGNTLTIDIQGDGIARTKKNIDNHSRIAVFINNEKVIDEMINQLKKTLVVLKDKPVENAVITVIKLSETAMSTIAIKQLNCDENALISPTKQKKHLIEFIGDSITCGYGIDDENPNNHFSTRTENASKSYGYLTAQNLDADYSLVSISGYGIISGYTGDGNKVPTQTLPQYYDKLGFSYGILSGKKPQDFEWDFSIRQPDLIVINLGTNDDSYCAGDSIKEKDYEDNYISFIKQVREKNPNAMILCTLGIMGDRLFKNINSAVKRYTEETNDTNIDSFKFAVQSISDGYAADYHPTYKTQFKAANALSQKIKESLTW